MRPTRFGLHAAEYQGEQRNAKGKLPQAESKRRIRREALYTVKRRLYLANTRAEQVQSELITRVAYGKCEVWFVNIPVESMLIDRNRAFDNNVHEIYREIFKNELKSHVVKTDGKDVSLTMHESDGKIYAIAVNHSDFTQKINFITDMKLVSIHYGELDGCKPMDAVIAEFV